MATPLPELRNALRELHRNAFRDAILDNSERLFFERGIAAVKISDIAMAAGISVGSIYNHFKCKDEISTTVLLRRTDHFLARLRQLRGTNDALAELEEFIRQSLLWFEENRRGLIGYFGPLPNLEPSALAVPILRIVQQGQRQYEQVVGEHMVYATDVGVLPRNGPIDDVSWYFLLLLRAALTDWIQSERANPPSARSHVLLRLFLDGVVGSVDAAKPPNCEEPARERRTIRSLGR